MPIKRVQFPDGSVKRIEVPEGATNEDILAFVQSQHAEPAEWQPKRRSVDDIRAEGQGFNPAADMSGGERFMAGMGKSLYDTGRGLLQLGGGMDREDVDQQRQVDAPLMATNGGMGGNIVGTVGQFLVPGGAALRYGSMAPKAAALVRSATIPTSLRGAALQGAAVGATQQVGEDDSRLGNTAMGAGAGFIGGAIPKAVGATYRAGRNAVLSPTTTGAQREAVRTIRSFVDDPAQLMTPNPSQIPGARRTLFEETLVPGIARLETKARGAHGDHWVQLDAANTVAREKAIRAFAGDEAALSAAVGARSKATAPLYAAANKVDGVDTSRLLSQIKRLEKGQEGRPAVQNALGGLRGLLTREVPDAERMKAAIQPLKDFIASDRTSATNREAAKAAIAQIKAGEWPAGTFGNGDASTRGVGASSDAAREALAQARKALGKTHVGHDKMQVLANVRLTLGDMLNGKYGGETGAALAGSRALMAVKNQLDRVAAKASPEFAQATQTFRSMSGDINRMQAGQELLRAGSSSIPDPLSKLYPLLPGKFGEKVKNLDSLVQSATGFRKASPSGAFQPEDLSTINAINDDLSREAKRLPYGNGGGSHTASQAEVGITLAGKALLRKVPWMGPAIEHLDAVGQARVMNVLSEMLANPAEFRRVAADLPAEERRLVEQAFTRIGSTAGALSPALAE